MFDFAKSLLQYMPSYLGDLFNVFLKPRSHITNKMTEDAEKAWSNCLQFSLLSFLLVFLLKWVSFGDARDIQSIVVGEGILSMLEYVVSGGLLFIIWRVFGLNKTPRELITPFFFMLGVLILVNDMFFLTQLGLVKMIEPALFEMFVGMQAMGNMDEMLAQSEQQLANADPEMAQAAMNAVTAVSLIGAVFVIAWLLYAWQVYKRLFNVGYAKLYGALVVFLIVDEFNPVGFIKVFVAALWA